MTVSKLLSLIILVYLNRLYILFRIYFYQLYHVLDPWTLYEHQVNAISKLLAPDITAIPAENNVRAADISLFIPDLNPIQSMYADASSSGAFYLYIHLNIILERVGESENGGLKLRRLKADRCLNIDYTITISIVGIGNTANLPGTGAHSLDNIE